MSDEFEVRDAICGAISNAPAKADRTALLESLHEDYLFMTEVLKREIEYRKGPTLSAPTKAVEKPAIKKIFHSPKEVADEFGLAANDVKNKHWRDANNFPYRQFKEGGKVTYYREEIELWREKR